MKYILSITALLSAFAAVPAHAQDKVITPPEASQAGSYYARPMDILPLLSGTFAEFRPGHFHSGIDLRTEGREGIPVRAIANGTVARIAYSASGFGRVVYMNHPNGTTSVYAHLQRFTPEMEAFFDAVRYSQQKDQVDTVIPAGKFRFKKGDLIGYSGNSGGSGGPHLHFEIRETASQRTLNTVANGAIILKDDIRPTIGRLFYIRVDTVMGVPVNAEPREIKLASTVPGRYTAAQNEVPVAGNGYFAIEAIDYMNGTQNRMGIYRIVQTVDGETVIEIERNKFLFSDTRYVNAMAHYALNRASSMEVIRLAVMAGNRLPMYHNLINRGALAVQDSMPHSVEILVEDEHNNRSHISLTVRATPYQYPALPIPLSMVPIARHDRPFGHSLPEAGISIPAGALYEPIFYTRGLDTAAVKGLPISTVQRFHDENIPLHAYVNIWVAAQVPAARRAQACLARVSADGRLSYVDGTWAAATSSLPERVTARVRDFGCYCVTADTIAPRIVPGFRTGADLRASDSLKFTVTDDFSGVKGYRCTIDGRWALVEWDPKNRTLTHPFNRTRFPAGTHNITLSITDGAGNSTSWRGTFIN